MYLIIVVLSNLRIVALCYIILTDISSFFSPFPTVSRACADDTADYEKHEKAGDSISRPRATTVTTPKLETLKTLV